MPILVAARAGSGWLAFIRTLKLTRSSFGSGVTVDSGRFSAPWIEYARRAYVVTSQLTSLSGTVHIRGLWPEAECRSALSGGSASLALALGMYCLVRDHEYPDWVFSSACVADETGTLTPGNPLALQAKIDCLDHIWKQEKSYLFIGGTNLLQLRGPKRGTMAIANSVGQAFTMLEIRGVTSEAAQDKRKCNDP